jgi:2-polyprenyl-6-methoxyphenol hydroxylase-like FAD-dependent oxidoreductase
MTIEVAVVGAGIAGLVLAHGLRKAGITVSVHERGPRQGDRHWLTGFQIHINPQGAGALQACLDDATWQTMSNNACTPPAGFQMLSPGMAETGFRPGHAGDARGLPIVRKILRAILLQPLAGAVEFNRQFVGYERTADGRVRADFADGRPVVADVLVGADGTGSRVRKQYLPAAEILQSRLVGAQAMLPVDVARRIGVPEHLFTRLTSIQGVHYMIVTHSVRKPEADPRLWDFPDHLIWVLVAKREAYAGQNPKLMEGAAVKERVLALITGWHPAFRRLVSETDPHEISASPILTSRPIVAWPATNVTLVGDAIHTMTPLQGLGGSTALRDAALLCQKLAEADRGGQGLLAAIGEYETDMRDYGFEAVRQSARRAEAIAAGRVLPFPMRWGLRLARFFPFIARRAASRAEHRSRLH